MSNCVNKGCAAYKGPCLNDMPGVVCYGFMPPITNADRIRAMSDEELAEWINKHDCYTNLYGYDHKEAIYDWLRQEVEEHEI